MDLTTYLVCDDCGQPDATCKQPLYGPTLCDPCAEDAFEFSQLEDDPCTCSTSGTYNCQHCAELRRAAYILNSNAWNVATAEVLGTGAHHTQS